MYKKNVLITVTTLNTGTTRPLDKREYLMMIFVISHRNQNVVNPHLNRLGKTVQMRGHNICFYAELAKKFPELSPNTPSYIELWKTNQCFYCFYLF